MVRLPRVARPFPPATQPASPCGRPHLRSTPTVITPIVVTLPPRITGQLPLLLATLTARARTWQATLDARPAHQNGSSVEPPGLEPGSAGCTSALTCVDT